MIVARLCRLFLPLPLGDPRVQSEINRILAETHPAFESRQKDAPSAQTSGSPSGASFLVEPSHDAHNILDAADSDSDSAKLSSASSRWESPSSSSPSFAASLLSAELRPRRTALWVLHLCREYLNFLRERGRARHVKVAEHVLLFFGSRSEWLHARQKHAVLASLASYSKKNVPGKAGGSLGNHSATAAAGSTFENPSQQRLQQQAAYFGAGMKPKI